MSLCLDGNSWRPGLCFLISVKNRCDCAMESSFGNQLKTLRGRVRQLKQSDVARRLNVSVVSVSYWENDFNKPKIGNLKSLISLLFVEGAFTSAKEIEQFWQATDVPIDEVWLADLMKK